ncbi:GNAT family N-acetyltransferase [Corynebacterium sp. DNF00584]|uniref:GNAT family N-acetyltransferase n=1 Tax=Corynebacterium sp. DNF00584 TaxID=1384076 RepID=UPI0018D202CB|nr:GNAT family N-acetyltransferase [Corynebacterium sp. DNF00584]
MSHVTCSLGGYERNFYEEPAEFRAAASEYLKEHLRETSVLATQANKPKLEDQPYWFATITDGDDIVGAAMRTKPTPPHPAYVQKLRPAALAALQDALSERGEKLPGCIGHFETAKALAGPGARLEMHSRLHFFDEVVWPACPAGELRAATPDDVDLIVDWRRQFVHDSEEQAGRKPCEKRYAAFFNAADVAERLARGGHWLWEVDGQPVHYTAVNDTGLGLKRIGPVFTPAAERGQGYAAWVVATLTQDILDDGEVATLYTDRANPVSNRVYERIGYQSVGDEGEFYAAGCSAAS